MSSLGTAAGSVLWLTTRPTNHTVNLGWPLHRPSRTTRVTVFPCLPSKHLSLVPSNSNLPPNRLKRASQRPRLHLHRLMMKTSTWILLDLTQIWLRRASRSPLPERGSHRMFPVSLHLRIQMCVWTLRLLLPPHSILRGHPRNGAHLQCHLRHRQRSLQIVTSWIKKKDHCAPRSEMLNYSQRI